jgi:exonuclease SbcC
MLKSISISNFQSHRDSTLEFSENVNVILGASDSGKTAILRALRWVAFHKPSGDEMRSHWGGKTQVSVVTDDCTVTKSKDKEQEYILGDTHFKAFGTEVPQEIKDALNLDSGNLQLQLDQPFLLSETPGKVAEHFNKIAHLEVIDKATSNINSAIRELTSDIKYSEGQETSLKENLEKYQYLETFQSEVEVLEEQDKLLVKTSANADKLGKLLETYQVNTTMILGYKDTLELEKPMDAILADIELRAEKDIAVVKLDKLIVQLVEIQSSIEKKKGLLLIEKPVNDLLKLYKEKEMAELQRKVLFKAIESVGSVQVRLKTAKVSYDMAHASFEKNMGSVCILCGQNIKNVKN